MSKSWPRKEVTGYNSSFGGELAFLITSCFGFSSFFTCTVGSCGMNIGCPSADITLTDQPTLPAFNQPINDIKRVMTEIFMGTCKTLPLTLRVCLSSESASKLCHG
jgi:putative lipase involved disintegration of autophagic bodies